MKKYAKKRAMLVATNNTKMSDEDADARQVQRCRARPTAAQRCAITAARAAISASSLGRNKLRNSRCAARCRASSRQAGGYA